MKNTLANDGTQIPDLVHAARHYRTVVEIFEKNLDNLFQNSRLAPEVNHEALALAFSRWRKLFDDTKFLAHIDRRDFVIYAAGLMLRELLVAHPLKTSEKSSNTENQIVPDQEKLLTRWPEGYAYTTFCLSVAGAILSEMGGNDIEVLERLRDPAFWDSFRENSIEVPAISIAFFDLICGQTPNWTMPDIPGARKALAPKHNQLRN